jgi:hypothetical protein
LCALRTAAIVPRGRRGLAKREGFVVNIRRRDIWRCASLLLVLASATAALAQATSPAPDLKTIVGKWSGTGNSAAGTNPLEWTIKEDGSVDVVATTPRGNVTGVARMSVKDGKFFYESGSSSGPVTLREDGGRRVLKYEAVFKRDNSRGGAELTPAK